MARRLRSTIGSIMTQLVRGLRSAAVLGVVMAVLLGLSGGGAYAYFAGGGTGTGKATVGSPVTISVTAASGTADLLPGGSGSAYFTLNNNTDPLGATFSQVTAASVSSTSRGSCTSANISFPTLPYTFSPAVTVGASTTSGTQSIPALVKLSASAPSACQGVTFTVSLTLSGQSS